jgi:soluble lytic murein transglycosylase-like protein
MLAAIFTCSGTAPGSAESACEREMAAAAQAHGIPLGVLYAVGLTETGRGGSLSPYALNIDGKPSYDVTPAEALRRLEAARRAGARTIDVGCMQINHRFHARHFASVAGMLDPPRNVAYAARFLRQLKEREGSWTMAVARYHAGPDNDPAQKRYVCRVISNMVASGFGGWTADARQFCSP